MFLNSDIQENVILYDWFTCTTKHEDPQVWIDLIGMAGEQWEEKEYGRHGYRKMIWCGSISIMYDGGQPGMGSCLDMSGQGCRTFEEYSTITFPDLFQIVMDNPHDFHVTRLDVAFDDHEGILDIRQIWKDADAYEYVSRARYMAIQKEFKDREASNLPGITIYHGSPQSEFRLRIYDKAAERGYGSDRHWIRVEMQLRDNRALAFIQQPEPIGVKFRGVLFNYVRYVDPDDLDSNRWRWPMKQYWADLIEGIERIRLYTAPGIEYNLMNLDRFVFDQAGNAITTALQIHGSTEFFDRLRSRTVAGNPKYEKLLKEYGRSKNGNRNSTEKRPAIPKSV